LADSVFRHLPSSASVFRLQAGFVVRIKTKMPSVFRLDCYKVGLGKKEEKGENHGHAA